MWSLFCALVMGAVCQFAAADEEKADVVKSVPEVLKDIETLGPKPDLNAKFYIYMRSASWCSWCNRITPAIVEAYPKMKEKGVEIIMISGDKSDEVAREHMQKHGINFPVVWGQREKLQELPCFKQLPGYFPACLYTDAEGKFIGRGNGVCMKDWEAMCAAPRSKANMQEKLKLLVPMKKEIDKKAKFFVFTWVTYDRNVERGKDFLQQMQAVYEEVTKKHGELIVLISNFSHPIREAYMEGDYAFPAVAKQFLEGCFGVPGRMYGQGAVVDARGTLLTVCDEFSLPDWQAALETMKANKEKKAAGAEAAPRKKSRKKAEH